MERRFSISADDEYAASADALHRATHILVAAGAGASADSGLPTYAEMPAAYNDLCRAEIFLERPEYGYGFWAGCVRDYRKAAPHAGLNILERWLSTKARGNCYVYTSNVDGHFRRFPTLGRQLCEIHGCVEEWMCGSSMGFMCDEAAIDVSDLSREMTEVRSRGGAFAEHNERLIQQQQQQQQQEGDVPWRAECAAWRTRLNDKTIREIIAKCNLSKFENSGSVSSPVCPLCESPIRPQVLMFADSDPVLLERLGEEAECYQEWEDAMEDAVSGDETLSLVVLEIGCGERVPSVRLECEAVARDCLKRGGNATLIRINKEGALPMIPEDEPPSDSIELCDHTIFIRGAAAEVLQRIDALMPPVSFIESGFSEKVEYERWLLARWRG